MSFCFADCGALTNITNGTVSTAAGTLEGANATYSCTSGYVLSGVVTRTCVNGIWSGTQPNCLKGNKFIDLYIFVYYNSSCGNRVMSDVQDGLTTFKYRTIACSRYTCTANF